MVAPTPNPRPSPLLPAILSSSVSLGPTVMADDPCDAASSGADPTGPRKYYRARYYDPKIGRFISEDPAGTVDGPNLYAYVQNAPTNWTDPSGLFTCIPAAGSWWIGPLALLHRIPRLNKDTWLYNTLYYDVACPEPLQPEFLMFVPGPGTSPELFEKANPTLLEEFRFGSTARFVASIQTRVTGWKPTWQLKNDILLCYVCKGKSNVCPLPQ